MTIEVNSPSSPFRLEPSGMFEGGFDMALMFLS